MVATLKKADLAADPKTKVANAIAMRSEAKKVRALRSIAKFLKRSKCSSDFIRAFLLQSIFSLP